MADTRAVTVVGATGRQGGAVARRLLEQGWTVKAISRDPLKPSAQALASRGVEVVAANFDDDASLDAALSGTAHLFAVTNFWEGAPGPMLGEAGEARQGVALMDAAARAGVRHVVFSSAAGAFGPPSEVAHVASKQRIEARLRASGMDWTILRPTFFMENVLVPWMGVWDKILEGELALPLAADRKLQMVSVEDIGAFAASAFEQPDIYRGSAFDVAGDELLGSEMAAQLSVALQKEVRFTGSPDMIPFIRMQHEDAAAMWEHTNAQGTNAFLAGLRALRSSLLTFAEFLEQQVVRRDSQGAG